MPPRQDSRCEKAARGMWNMQYRIRATGWLPRSVAAVAPIHFTFGWGYALLAGTRVQKERYNRKCEKPWQQFSIHYRRHYCVEH